MEALVLLLGDQSISSDSVKFIIEIIGVVGAAAALFMKIGSFEATVTQRINALEQKEEERSKKFEDSLSREIKHLRERQDEQAGLFKETLAKDVSLLQEALKAQQDGFRDGLREIKGKTDSFSDLDGRVTKIETHLEQIRSEFERLRTRLSGTYPALSESVGKHK